MLVREVTSTHNLNGPAFFLAKLYGVFVTDTGIGLFTLSITRCRFREKEIAS